MPDFSELNGEFVVVNAQAFALTVFCAYLIGSIPFSLLIARFFGKIDLRLHGSGNIGATNVARTMGARWGTLALLMDAAKGLLATGILPLIITMPEEDLVHQRVLAAICAVLGHMYSCWVEFRGGKGVATALGAVVVLAPLATLIAFLGFAGTFLKSRIVSLSSIVAAIVFAITQLVTYGSKIWQPTTWSLGVFSVFVPTLILFQHRSNMVRLLRGQEQPLQFKKSSATEPLSNEPSASKH